MLCTQTTHYRALFSNSHMKENHSAPLRRNNQHLCREKNSTRRRGEGECLQPHPCLRMTSLLPAAQCWLAAAARIRPLQHKFNSAHSLLDGVQWMECKEIAAIKDLSIILSGILSLPSAPSGYQTLAHLSIRILCSSVQAAANSRLLSDHLLVRLNSAQQRRMKEPGNMYTA